MSVWRDAQRYTRDLVDLNRITRDLWTHRELIAMMAWRAFSARYRGSLGGLAWSVLYPATSMALYTVVFSLILQVRFGNDASPLNFAIYLLCGLLPWQAISDSTALSATIIKSNVNLVKRVVFPLQILPINLVLAAAIQQTIGFVLLIPLVGLVTGQFRWTLILVPIIFALQFLLAAGVSWSISSLAVFVPELQQLTSLFLTFWMFLTPILYPETMLPAQLQWLFRINPLAQLISFYRAALVTGQLPPLFDFLTTAALCLGIFLVGYFWFTHTQKGFADVL